MIQELCSGVLMTSLNSLTLSETDLTSDTTEPINICFVLIPDVSSITLISELSGKPGNIGIWQLSGISHGIVCELSGGKVLLSKTVYC